MVKNLLFIFVFFFTAFGFAQSNDEGVITQKQDKKTITNLSASPNPFNIKSVISFDSTLEQSVFFEIKNILGKNVLKQKIVAVIGKNELNFFKDNLPSGMYIYSIQTDAEVISKRMVIK